MIYIDNIRFVNCQSWKDETVIFKKGLNVIRAENNTGKSVIFKFLKLTCSPTYFSRREREYLIRHGADYAEVTYLFSDKSVAVVRVFPQRIIYYFTPNYKTVDYTQKQDIPHPDILDRLSLIVENESGFIANLLDRDQDLLLVSSNMKSNSNLVKVLTEHRQLTRLRYLFKDKIQQYRTKAEHVSSIKVKLSRKIAELTYIDTDQLQEQIIDGDLYLSTLKLLMKVYETIDSMEGLVEDYIPCDDYIAIAELGTDLESLNLESVNTEEIIVDNSLITISSLGLELEEISASLNSLELVHSNTINDLILLENMIEVFSKLYRIDTSVTIQSIKEEEYLIHTIKTLISAHNTMSDILSMVEDMNTAHRKIKEYRTLINIQGEALNCPIHGQIKYYKGECIPCE